MSDEIKDLISDLEDALSSTEDAESAANSSHGSIESAISLINDLQNELDKPRHCDKCQALIDLQK